MAFDQDVCIGFGAPEHPHPVDQLGPDWLCPACSARLSAAVADQGRPTAPAVRECIAGGHPAGSRYYSCLACYGD